MTVSFLDHDGLRFRARSKGDGQTVVFLHGLGGDTHQPCGLLKDLVNCRLVTVDLRGHGETFPLGPEHKLTISQFADDVAALLNCLSLPTCILGGISLGAAVALQVALRYPELISGLILARPAWLEGPNVNNKQLYRAVAHCIRRHGAEQGKQLFAASELFRELMATSADAASSLLGQFDSPYAEERVARLEQLPADKVIDRLSELEVIRTPAIVLANRNDIIHPFEFGEAIAEALPRAHFVEIPSKASGLDRHSAGYCESIRTFINELQTERASVC